MKLGKWNANQLKMIAIIAMLLDHIAALFIPHENILWVLFRTFGRVTAPIMCFMIAEGYYYTANRYRYLGRLLLFSVISHVPFALCMGYDLSFLTATSVMWSLAMGLLALMIVKEDRLRWIFRLGGLAVCCLLAYTANWNYVVVLWVVMFGVFRGNKWHQLLAFAVVGFVVHMGQQMLPLLMGSVSLDAFTKWYQFGIFLAIPLLLCYDGTRGKKSKLGAQFFYWFYPVHLMILYLLNRFVL